MGLTSYNLASVMASPSGLAVWPCRLALPLGLAVWPRRVCASRTLALSSKHLLAARVLRLTRLRFGNTFRWPIHSRFSLSCAVLFDPNLGSGNEASFGNLMCISG
jgi:hypothetical protein